MRSRNQLTAQGFVAYWGKSGHRSALALNGPGANDPKRSFASISCCSSEAGLSPYQSTRLSRYDAAS